MKKIFLYGAVVLAAISLFSCEKTDTTPESPAGSETPGGPGTPGGPALTPSQHQEKLDAVAVEFLKEVDPDVWHQPVEDLLDVALELGQYEEGNLDEDLLEYVAGLWRTVPVGGEPSAVWVIKLSDLKGDITVVDNEFHWTQSNNPLNFTYNSFKVTLEARDSNQKLFITEMDGDDGAEDIYVMVPSRLALNITKDGAPYASLELQASISGLDSDGNLGEHTVASVSASASIAGFVLTIEELKASMEEVQAALSLTFNGKELVYASASSQLSLQALVKSVSGNGLRDASLMDQIRFKSAVAYLKILGGKVINKASVTVPEDEASDTETINKSINVDLFYDNDESTVQASFVAIPDGDGDWLPGLHFYDGSADKVYYEFFTEKAFDSTITWMDTDIDHFYQYFEKYFSKESDV